MSAVVEPCVVGGLDINEISPLIFAHCMIHDSGMATLFR
jgi:hypothetical protein